MDNLQLKDVTEGFKIKKVYIPEANKLRTRKKVKVFIKNLSLPDQTKPIPEPRPNTEILEKFIHISAKRSKKKLIQHL